MINRELLRQFPTRRLKPEDGLAVTARVWESAHDYHRQRLRFHDLLRHGPGILTGLGVIASDPADSTVYILPGVAVDPCGETIALTEPMAYDVGSTQGLLYLLLTYEDSVPSDERAREDEPLYIHARFGIEAMPNLPEGAYVELARIKRLAQDAPVTDARNTLHPAANEIDLRFRPEMGAVPLQVASLAVCYTGGPSIRHHGHAVDLLANALRHGGQRLAVDDNVPLATELDAYTLVYLVGQEAFKLNRDEMNALYAYLQGGGTVLIESCRRQTATGNPPADASFSDLLASMGISLEEVGAEHGLFLEPHLFAAPPQGFETEGTPSVLAGGGVIFSTHDYGCLWQGKRRSRAASREEIRTATEWGENILAYALERQLKKGTQ
jgi:hypothetical protein